MQWNKVKTILIVVFLLINAYLLVHYINSSQNGISVSPSVIDDAVLILENNAIQIDKRIIPTAAQEIRVFDVTNRYGEKEALAELFLGDGYFKNEQSVFTKDNNTLWINQGNFDLVLLQNDDMPVLPSLQGLSEANCRKYAGEIIEQYRLGGTYLRLISSVLENNIRKMHYARVFDERPIVDSLLTITLTEKGMSKLEGRNWLGDTIVEGPFVSTRTAVEALVNFANNPTIDRSIPMEITQIEEGYYFGSRAPEIKTVTAIPVWRIVTKEHGSYIYDARNITLIK